MKFTQTDSGKSSLLKLRETRWVERHDAFICSVDLYNVTALFTMSHWEDTITKRIASHLHAATIDVDFVMTLMATVDVMGATRPLSIKLQTSNQDLGEEVKHINVRLSEQRSK